jgi:hypothetical protein
MNVVSIDFNNKVKVYESLKGGDFLVAPNGDIYILSCIGIKNYEAQYMAVNITSGYSLDDSYNTIEAITEYVQNRKWSVYRGSKLNLALGNRIMYQGEFQ